MAPKQVPLCGCVEVMVKNGVGDAPSCIDTVLNTSRV